MSRSWNHFIRKLSEDELAGMRRRADDDEQRYPDKPWRRWEEQCRVSKCIDVAVYLGSYDYVTGRQGRTSYRCRFLCERHGRQYAEKHALTIERETESQS